MDLEGLYRDAAIAAALAWMSGLEGLGVGVGGFADAYREWDRRFPAPREEEDPVLTRARARARELGWVI